MTFDLKRSLIDLDKTTQIKQIITQLQNLNVCYGDVIKINDYIFGTFPNQGYDT